MSTNQSGKRKLLPSTIPRLSIAHPLLTASNSSMSSSHILTSTSSDISPSCSAQALSPSRNLYPPTAFRTPQVYPLSSGSLPPYRERPTDLSGIKNQLHLRNYSVYSLPGPDAVTTTVLRSPASKIYHLHKSQTLACMNLPENEPSPERRLVRPLGPPMLRSQTLGDMSDVTKRASLSSSIPTTSIPIRPSIRCVPKQEVDVVDALLESQMTDQEIELYNQVQREANINQQCLQTSFRLKRPQSLDPAPRETMTVEQQSSPSKIDLHLSTNDIVNRRKLEEQRHKTAVSRPWYVNSAPIVPESKKFAEPSVRALGKGEAECINSVREDQRKIVYFHEDIPYWIGRYLSLYDRLRTADFPSLQTQYAYDENSSLSLSKSFDMSEQNYITQTLSELRSCCRTAKALESFETFEKGLKAKDQNLPIIPYVPSALRDSHNGLANSRRERSSFKSNENLTTRNKAELVHSTRQAVQPETQRQQPLLVKSKTMGDLSEQRFQPPVRSQLPSKSSGLPLCYHQPTARRETSALHAQAWKERELRAAKRAAAARRGSTSLISPYRSEDASEKPNQPRTQKTKALPIDSKSAQRTTIIKVSEPDELRDGAIRRAVEYGHEYIPRTMIKKLPAQASDKGARQHNDPSKMTSNPNRSGRGSNSELVSSLVGAGVRKARQIGRRVSGSLSWLNDSNEKLVGN